MTTLGTVDEPVDGDCFEALYRDSYAALVRLACLLLGHRAGVDAEEVVQEAFAELHRRWMVVETPGAYVRAAVVNGCRKSQRRAAMGRNRADALGESGPAVLGADHMADAIARLPDRQRAVVVLRFYEDMSEADIAAALRCRPGTVKSLASRALAELRRVIER